MLELQIRNSFLLLSLLTFVIEQQKGKLECRFIDQENYHDRWNHVYLLTPGSPGYTKPAYIKDVRFGTR